MEVVKKMTGIIVCENCGTCFIANGSLELIKNKTPLVHVLLASKLKIFTGSREIQSRLIGTSILPQFRDLCKRCTIKK